MKGKLFLLCLITLFLYGCVETSVIDELQIVTSIGIDYVSKTDVELTASTPIYDQNENVTNSTLSAISGTNRGVRNLLNTRTPKPISAGKITVVLIEEKLAKTYGLASVLDSLSRDSSFGTRHKIGITPGKTKDMYSIDFPYDMDIAEYIHDEIEHNEKQQKIPRSNVHLFFKRYYQVGQDPFLPYLKKSGKNSIQVAGTALFKGDLFIHHLGLNESYVMKILYESFSSGNYEVALKGAANYAMIRDVQSRPTYTIERNTNTPTIHITLNLKGSLVEYIGKGSADNRVNETERALKEQLESDADKVIRLFQEKEIDPLGIGSRVRSLNYHFNAKEWEEYYPHADIKVTANVKIVSTGVLE